MKFSTQKCKNYNVMFNIVTKYHRAGSSSVPHLRNENQQTMLLLGLQVIADKN